METTRYFEEQVLRKRRFWGRVVPDDERQPRYLRVVTLADGKTLHNAFFDRNFREAE